MAGARQSCNHSTVVMYKVEYAMKKGYLDPAYTSVPCAWNQSTNKEMEPKMIKDKYQEKNRDQREG